MPRLDPIIAMTTWIEAALIIFVVVFVAITIWVIVAKAGSFDRAARIPLDDDVVTPRHREASPPEESP